VQHFLTIIFFVSYCSAAGTLDQHIPFLFANIYIALNFGELTFLCVFDIWEQGAIYISPFEWERRGGFVLHGSLNLVNRFNRDDGTGKHALHAKLTVCHEMRSMRDVFLVIENMLVMVYR
jgi:hypothetical protein